MTKFAGNIISYITYLSYDSSYGLILFVTVCSILLMIGFPSWLVTVASGCIYGIVFGFFIYLVCVCISEIIVYLIGLGLSNSSIINKCHMRSRKVIKYLNDIASSEHILYLLVLLKLNPLVPFIPITFYLGVRKFKYLHLLFASVIGSIPFGFLWTYQGQNLHDLAELTSLSKRELLGSYDIVYLSFCILITFVAIFIMTKIIKKHKNLVKHHS